MAHNSQVASMYILRCADGSFYVGSTRNLDQRMVQHESSEGARYTSWRLPFDLVYVEDYERIADAYAREKQVQNWSRAKRIALIEGRFGDLNALSRKRPK
jgi:putative endonuclease